jgi:hypothetical protein
VKKFNLTLRSSSNIFPNIEYQAKHKEKIEDVDKFSEDAKKLAIFEKKRGKDGNNSEIVRESSYLSKTFTSLNFNKGGKSALNLIQKK